MMKCDKFMQIVYFGTQFAPENFFWNILFLFIYLLLTLPYNNNLKKTKWKKKNDK